MSKWIGVFFMRVSVVQNQHAGNLHLIDFC